MSAVVVSPRVACPVPSSQVTSPSAQPGVRPPRSSPPPTNPGASRRQDSGSAQRDGRDQAAPSYRASSPGIEKRLPPESAGSRTDRAQPHASRAPARRAYSPPQEGGQAKEKADHPILFQQFFKSVGPRTYAVQVKQATNGNHYIVFTEGRRDDKTDDVRKTRINIFSEDFDAFFDLLRQAAQHVKNHPLPPEFVAKRKKFWASVAKRKSKAGARPKPGADAGGSFVAASRTGASPIGRANRPSTPQGLALAGQRPMRESGDERPTAHSNDVPRDSHTQPASPPRSRAARPLPTARAAAAGG